MTIKKVNSGKNILLLVSFWDGSNFRRERERAAATMSCFWNVFWPTLTHLWRERHKVYMERRLDFSFDGNMHFMICASFFKEKKIHWSKVGLNHHLCKALGKLVLRAYCGRFSTCAYCRGGEQALRPKYFTPLWRGICFALAHSITERAYCQCLVIFAWMSTNDSL